MYTGGLWKDPSPISACFTDGNLVTGAAWPGHPEFLKQILKVLSATVQGGDKKILMLCGVCVLLHNLPVDELKEKSYDQNWL